MAGTLASADHDEACRRIDENEWRELYIVGDVHGCRETLDRLVDRIAPCSNDLLVFVGDLVRKGPDSAGVLDFLTTTENAIAVRGNNEQKLLDGVDPPPELDQGDVATLGDLPLVISWDCALAVHGGLAPDTPLAEHDRDELLTLRSLSPAGGYTRPFWFETRRSGPRVFFGHTVLAEPFETAWAVGLDTGAVYGGSLTAYAWREQRFYSVNPPKTYRQRSSDSFVCPRPPTAEGTEP